MGEKEVIAEIEREIQKSIEDGEAVPRAWLVKRLIDRHSDIRGNDAEFAKACVRIALNAEVQRAVRAFDKKNDSDPAQGWLPGYEHIQPGYTITRDGQSIVVPTPEMTVAELRGKADELRAMAKGLQAHARELDRYAAEREEREETDE